MLHLITSSPDSPSRSAVEDAIIIWSGPPEHVGQVVLRTNWEDFQRACSADTADAWANHPWAKLQRDIAAAMFRPEPGGSADVDAVLSAKAGCKVHVGTHSVGFGRFRDIWTVSVHVPLSGIETAGDRAYLRTPEFRNCLAGLLGLVWQAEWVYASLMTTPQS